MWLQRRTVDPAGDAIQVAIASKQSLWLLTCVIWIRAAILFRTITLSAILTLSLHLVPQAAVADAFVCQSDFVCALPLGTGGGSGAATGTSTAAYLGMQWNFGSNQPEMTVGLRWLKAGDDNNVYGTKLDASVPLASDFLPTLRLLGVYGTETIQAELGAGYDFSLNSMIIGTGVQVPNVNFGANISLGGIVEPFVAVTSLAAPEFDREESSEVSCETGFERLAVEGSPGAYVANWSGTPVLVADQYVAGGYTCGHSA